MAIHHAGTVVTCTLRGTLYHVAVNGVVHKSAQPTKHKAIMEALEAELDARREKRECAK